MELGKILERATGVLARLGLAKGDATLGALDFGILEVALLVAALDGVIQPREVAAFRRLAERCRGYAPALAEEALRRGLRRAGYLLALAQTQTGTDEERLAAFVEAARAAMPRGFAGGDRGDVRRAFATWVAMGAADGEYADVERRAVEALAAAFADDRLLEVGQAAVTMAAAYPSYGAYVQSVAADAALRQDAQLLPEGFLDRVAALVAGLGDDAARTEAEARLLAWLQE